MSDLQKLDWFDFDFPREIKIRKWTDNDSFPNNILILKQIRFLVSTDLE
jgi:hypothetical protein